MEKSERNENAREYLDDELEERLELIEDVLSKTSVVAIVSMIISVVLLVSKFI